MDLIVVAIGADAWQRRSAALETSSSEAAAEEELGRATGAQLICPPQHLANQTTVRAGATGNGD